LNKFFELVLIIFFASFFFGITVTLSSQSYNVGVVYTNDVINSFYSLKSKLMLIDKKIQEKQKELYNLHKNLQKQFITEIENYMENLKKQQQKMEREIAKKIYQTRDLDQQIKQKILSLKQQTESKIKNEKQKVEKKLYELEKQLYSQIQTELLYQRNRYQNMVNLEIQKHIYHSKEALENYKQQLYELYKNELTNLNLKIVNSSVYESEELIKRRDKIKQKQSELIESKTKEIEKQLYEKINNIQDLYQAEYKKLSQKVIHKYQEQYKLQHEKIVKDYQSLIESLEKEYNQTIMSLLQKSNNLVGKEIYQEYNSRVKKLEQNFQKFKDELSRKYDQLFLQKFNHLQTQIEQLEEEKNSIINQFNENMFNVINKIAKEQNLKYVFCDPIATYKCKDITKQVIYQMKKETN